MASQRKNIPKSNDLVDAPETSVSSDGYRHSVDQDYAISILMELQKSMGKLESVIF